MFLTKLKMMSATMFLAAATAGSVAVIARQSSPPRPAPQSPVTRRRLPLHHVANSTERTGRGIAPRDRIDRPERAEPSQDWPGGIHAYVEATRQNPSFSHGFLGADGKPLLSCASRSCLPGREGTLRTIPAG